VRATRGRGEAGVVGANLAIVLAFALFAVIQLTRTTIAAEQIDDKVRVIVGEVEPIDEELNAVPILDEVDRSAREILVAAQPLTGLLNEVVGSAGSIDTTVSSILSNATSINGTVRGIGGTVSSLQPVVRSINDGVAAINGRADRIIALVRGIQGDTGNVLAEVGGASPGGHAGPGGKSIHGHANSIDCRLSILTLGAPGACEG
jgi:methyl-accepting chemotaxis protein